MEIMKKISGFKTKEKVDMLIDRFEEMVTEIEAVKLVERLKYALSAKFVDRFEESGKIISNEKAKVKGHFGRCGR